MNIVFATDYHPPFAPGGAQWTSAVSAEARPDGAPDRHRHPNYGAASREEHDGVEVNRFPFPIRLSPGQQEGGWLLHRNPAVGLYFAWWIWRTVPPQG